MSVAVGSVSALAVVAADAPVRGPDRLAAHLLLTAAVVAIAALGWFLMWRGWRRRVRRGHPDLPPLPPVPAEGSRGSRLLPAERGLYVGTVTAGHWLDRVAAEGLSARSAGRLQVTGRGVLVDRDGAAPLWLPADALRSVRVDEALAGKVMGKPGLLVIRWRHGPYELETGFRADDRDRYAPIVTAVRTLVPVSPGEQGEDAAPEALVAAPEALVAIEARVAARAPVDLAAPPYPEEGEPRSRAEGDRHR